MVLDDAGLAEGLDLHALFEGPLRQVLLRLVEDPEEALSLILFERAKHFDNSTNFTVTECFSPFWTWFQGR